jgi:hypothetical protein
METDYERQKRLMAIFSRVHGSSTLSLWIPTRIGLPIANLRCSGMSTGRAGSISPPAGTIAAGHFRSMTVTSRNAVGLIPEPFNRCLTRGDGGATMPWATRTGNSCGGACPRPRHGPASRNEAVNARKFHASCVRFTRSRLARPRHVNARTLTHAAVRMSVVTATSWTEAKTQNAAILLGNEG